MFSRLRVFLTGACLLFFTSSLWSATDSPLLDFKLDYKTTKKNAALIGWIEFNPPTDREPIFYKAGEYSGIGEIYLQTSENYPGVWIGSWVRRAFGVGKANLQARAASDGINWEIEKISQDKLYWGDGSFGSLAEVKSHAISETKRVTGISKYEGPPYEWQIREDATAQGANGQHGNAQWYQMPVVDPEDPNYDYWFLDYYFDDLKFAFSEPDSESDASDRVQEFRIHPNPELPPAEQPTPADIEKIGSSFRSLRTDREFVRYSSQFNLRLKLCPGEYILKWRVTGKHKDNTGAPEHFPQKRTIVIDENTPLDADGYYDLDWIDIAQKLTPDYIYRLSTYADDATQTFLITPKDKCGCADVGSGGVAFGSVEAWFNLGKDSAGKSGGFIQLHAENIETNTHMPEALTVVQGNSNSTHFEYTDGGVLRQAWTDQRIIDIVPLSNPTEGYQLKFYKAADATGWDEGRFRTFGSAAPQLVWTVKRLADAGGFKRVEITRSEGGKDFVQVFGQNLATPTTWSLSEAGGLKITTRSESSAPDGDIYRTTTLSDTVYGTASVKRERVHAFAWGEEIVEETLDPSGANPLTTSHQFYTSGAGQGQLWKTTTPDGTVTGNTYQSFDTGLGVITSRIASITVTYLNGRSQSTTYGTLADLTSNSADAAHSLVTTTESFGGQLVRRSWEIGYTNAVDIDGDGVLYTSSHSVRAASTSAAWNDSRNEVTIIRSANPDTGRINLTLSPDGKITRTHYGLADGNGVRIVSTESGPTNANGTGVLAGAGGTRIDTETDASGRILSRSEKDIASNLLTALEQVTDWSTQNPNLPTHTSYLDGSEEVRSYSSCCGKLESITRHGSSESYTYDDLGRQLTVTRDGITTESRYDAADRVRASLRYPDGQPSSSITQSASTYDPAGRLTATTDALSRTTIYNETVDAVTGKTTTVTTLPADTAEDLPAGVRTEIRHADGATVSITGNATAPVSYAYSTGSLSDASTWGFDSGDRFFVTVATKLDASGNATAETVTAYQDALGREIKTSYAGGAIDRQFFDSAGRVQKEVDPDGITTLHAYDSGNFGERTTTAIDLAATTGGARNGTLDLEGYDRVTRTTAMIANKDGVTVRRVTTEVWETSGSDTPTSVSVSETSMDSLKTWLTKYGQITGTATIIETNGDRTATTIYPDQTRLIRTLVDGRLASEVRKDATGQTITQLDYDYDSHGRLSDRTQVGVGTTHFTYFDDDQAETVTTPDPDATRSGVGYNAQVTTYAYNQRGWIKKVTNPDQTDVFTRYYPAGQVKRTWGSRTYPVATTYDAQGRKKTHTTWQDFAGQTGAAVTTWNYDSQRGWLNNKRYADDQGPGYTYTNAGRLKTRVWQRAVTTTYGYTDAGELETITYSDGTTPNVSHSYDRPGRNHTTTDAAGLLTRTYQQGRLTGEVYTGTGLLAGRSFTRTYDSQQRPQSFATDTGYSVGYGYDDSGRLDTVSEGFHLAKYGYKANVGSVETLTVKRSGVERVRHGRTVDSLGRTAQTKTTTGGSVTAVQRDYTYNDANQRTQIAHEDTRAWAYGYDALGQVTSAEKRLADLTTPLPGYRFGYTFDTIGNRSTTTINDRTATYLPDADLLNQYASRTVSGALDVRGEAHADATVTVNGLTTTRTAKDFYREVAATNTSSSVSMTLTIEATKAGPPVQTATDTRAAFLPLTPESYVHDDDGNLKQDGHWVNTWDGENRLIAQETLPAVASTFPVLKQRLEYSYDAQGRRIRKVVKLWDVSGSAWATSSDLRFLYDGWNLVSEIDALANTVIRTHAWGIDLSGSMQGAGGVGGLLWTNASSHTYAASSDANGNVVAWVNTATLAASGRTDYGAFGEVVLRTGVATELPFGFSSKYTDKETGQLYYGFRSYDPSTGRWLSRDPIQEKGGMNLYSIIGNNPIGLHDVLGLAPGGEYLTLKAAEDAAAQDVFSATKESVRLGREEAEKDQHHPDYVGTNFAIFNGSRLYDYIWLYGVEYATMVYCYSDSSGIRYSYGELVRGTLPTAYRYRYQHIAGSAQPLDSKIPHTNHKGKVFCGKQTGVHSHNVETLPALDGDDVFSPADLTWVETNKTALILVNSKGGTRKQNVK